MDEWIDCCMDGLLDWRMDGLMDSCLWTTKLSTMYKIRIREFKINEEQVSLIVIPESLINSKHASIVTLWKQSLKWKKLVFWIKVWFFIWYPLYNIVCLHGGKNCLWESMYVENENILILPHPTRRTKFYFKSKRMFSSTPVYWCRKANI